LIRRVRARHHVRYHRPIYGQEDLCFWERTLLIQEYKADFFFKAERLAFSDEE
jgi:hypothetical protein